jgi:protein-S-isoprenylcysteine O-methyltransferase Ste14
MGACVASRSGRPGSGQGGVRSLARLMPQMGGIAKARNSKANGHTSPGTGAYDGKINRSGTPKNMKANVLTLVVLLAALGLLLAHFWGQPWTPVRIAGAAIGTPSLALLILARIQLGGSFSVRAKARELVTHGLYSKIRNPIYVFSALTVAGIFLFIGAPRFLWLFVVLVPLQIYRARKEEQVLAAKFGDEYREYKARTWF